MIKTWKFLVAAFCSMVISSAYADVTIQMNLTTPTGVGKSMGTITVADTEYGLLLTPNLTGLSPGMHGFHIHLNPSCDNNGMAAAGHLDPKHTGKHLGPYNDKGHLGDLPVLMVDKDGTATTPTLAPRLKLADIINHSIMIHSGGDNYSDNPPMGGGDGRMVCGVIK